MNSTTPVAAALLGMPSNAAVSTLSARTTPPAVLTETMPCDPSLPLPERTMATARGPASAASERKNTSMGCGSARGSLIDSTSFPDLISISLPGGSR